MPRSKPKVIELFAGAGVFSSAFIREGFDVVLAIEADHFAAETYRKNLGNHVVEADVCSITPPGSCDVLIAGPPCQGFSTLNRRKDDPRNALSLEVVRWAKATGPKTVVIENVAAFIDSPVWAVVAERLTDLGYDVKATVVNAYDFGVPQLRRRSFTVATKTTQPALKPVASRPVKTVRQAWKGLPASPTGENFHYAPTPSILAMSRMKAIPPGGDKRDVMRNAPHLAPASWARLGNQVTDVWGRMSWDQPSNTLRTCLQNASKGRYIHPEENRVITLREAARLQTISDRWAFSGLPTHIARQIGNCVPHRLGRSVARCVKCAL